MSNESVTSGEVERILRIGEQSANNRASTLWAILAFAGLGVLLFLLLVWFVWYNFGLVHATWAIGVLLLIGSMVGLASMVSAWNDRVQERALRMVQTQMHTNAQLGQAMWSVDPQAMRRQNAQTLGMMERKQLTQQMQPAAGYIFEDDDDVIIEVNS